MRRLNVGIAVVAVSASVAMLIGLLVKNKRCSQVPAFISAYSGSWPSMKLL